RARCLSPSWCCAHPRPPPLPTRRSSDLRRALCQLLGNGDRQQRREPREPAPFLLECQLRPRSRRQPHDLVVTEPKERVVRAAERSEEHTSELQSRVGLVCRPLREQKKRR